MIDRLLRKLLARPVFFSVLEIFKILGKKHISHLHGLFVGVVSVFMLNSKRKAELS